MRKKGLLAIILAASLLLGVQSGAAGGGRKDGRGSNGWRADYDAAAGSV